MDYIDLAELLGVYVDRDSYAFKHTVCKYREMGVGLNNSVRLAYKEFVVEDIKNLRNQIKELQNQVNRIEHKPKEE